MPHVKYCDIERLGTPENSSMFDHSDDEIVIEEKVDGANFQFWLEDGRIHLGSRSRDLTVERDEKFCAKQQHWVMAHLSQRIDKINPSFRYYAEIMGKHTISYGDQIPAVIGIDIMPIEGVFGHPTLFLGRKAKQDAFAELEIPCVALKGIHKVKELNEEMFAIYTEASAYYNGKPEGIVIKNYGRLNAWGRQMFAKIVIDEFKETNRAVFGGAKRDTSDTVKIVNTYCTEARIKKRILSLINEGGHPLSRDLMKWLPVSVCQDIFKEETDAILKNHKDISLGTMKGLVAKKCLEMIDSMMVKQ